MTKLRAVTYARYSSKMQRETSIDDQRRNMHDDPQQGYAFRWRCQN